MQSLGTLQVSKKGNPIKPDLKTLDVNLTGAIYSESSSPDQYLPYLKSLRFALATATHLALHYLPKTRSPVEPLKYVILLGYLGVSSLPLPRMPSFLTMIIPPKSSVAHTTG